LRYGSLVGEHTGKILAELGYDEDVVAALQWSAAIQRVALILTRTHHAHAQSVE